MCTAYGRLYRRPYNCLYFFPIFGMSRSEGHFDGETRGNANPIVKVFKNAHELAVHALWTALPAIFRPKCTRSQDFAHGLQSQKVSGAETAELPQKCLCCLDPDANFRSARLRSHCSCVAKRPQVPD